VDFTAAGTLRAIYRTLKNMGIRLVFAEVSGDVRARLDRYRLTRLLGEDAFYETIGAAVEAYRQKGPEGQGAL
jgi:anti-anti-sigma regulatory factor